MELRTIEHLIKDKPLSIISPLDTVQQACVEMTRINSRALAVMVAGHLVGIVSEKDVIQNCIAKGLKPDKTEVNSIMTPHVHTIDKSEPISRAVKIMEKGGFHHVPVVDGNVKLVGVISCDDIPSEYRHLHDFFFSQSEE